MTDKELLELAAKAVGVRLEYACGVCWFGHQAGWNPLTDDGDALRLAVKLDLRIVSIYHYFDEMRQLPTVIKRTGGGMTEELVVRFPEYTESFQVYDPCAATRRAIVRAAAGIGKATP